MALPTKLYPDYDRTGGGQENFKFITRDSAAEMEYTAKTLAELMATTGYWATAEANVGTVLKDRFKAAEEALYTSISAHWSAKLTEINNSVGTTNADTAYAQYLLGMSAAFGSGHTNVGLFTNQATQDRKLAVIDTATKNLTALIGATYGAVGQMPLVVPIESQLVSDAAASAVEAHAMGQIRSQQIRQSSAAGDVLAATAPDAGTNPRPYEEVLAFQSVIATGLAANTK